MKFGFLRLIKLCGLVFPSQLNAQTDTTELENLTITATIATARQIETGRNITTLNGEFFHRLPVSSVDELLRYLPGIEVQQRGPQGSQSDIVIRGGTFQQVLLIIDGIRLNDPLTGHFNSYIPIHPGEIERIEILKGTAAALYGSEAVGGVIHIITKTFSPKRAGKNELQGGLHAGEKKLINVNSHFRFVKKNAEISGGLLSNHADGEQLRGTTGFFDNTTISFAWSQRLKNNWQLNLRSAADTRNFNAQNFYTTFLSDTANEKVRSFWQHAALYKTEEKYSISINAGYKNLEDEYWFRPSTIPNDNKTNLFVTQFTYTGKLGEKHSLVSGALAQRKKITSNDRGNHSLWHGAFFVIGKHRLADHFYLNESLRVDWDDNYGWVLIPQLNIAYNIARVTFRASAGKGIRDADFTERYNNYNKTLVTAGSIGNPGLKAERSFSAEAGVDYNFSDIFKANTTFFYRDQNDLIDWTPTLYTEMPRRSNLIPTGTYALAKNISRVKTKGWELDLVFKKQFTRAINFYSMAGVTYIESESSDAVPSFYISSHSRWLINFINVVNFHSFALSLNGIYKKRNEQKASSINATITPSYFIMNGKLAYLFYRKKIQAFFEVDNIFNKQYSDLLGSQMPGRWVSGGLQVNLFPQD